MPIITEKQRAINKYSKNKPTLNWNINNQQGVFNSGWNPLKGINICFRDESEPRGLMWIVIEINSPIFKRGLSLTSTPNIPMLCNDAQDDIIAYGYFFEKDPVTKKINMMLRIKPFRGRERMITYQNCQYFGLDYDEILEGSVFQNQHIIQSRFTLSNEWQDKALCTGVNLLHKHFRDFKYVVDVINDFIQANKIREHLVPEVVNAFPLLKPIKQIPVLITRYDLALYLREDGYLGHPTPMAVASIGDLDMDDDATYIPNVVIL